MRHAPGPSSASHGAGWNIRGASLLGLVKPRVANTSNSSGSAKGKTHAKDEADAGQSIYSPRIRLTYTPPTPLPVPFPKSLHLEGLHLYIASSIFVRHTLNALYTDLRVALTRVRVMGGQERGTLSAPR